MTDARHDFRHSQVAIGATSLHVVEIGDPAAPPVLFLHGWPESWRAWRDVMRIAAQDVRGDRDRPAGHRWLNGCRDRLLVATAVIRLAWQLIRERRPRRSNDR